MDIDFTKLAAECAELGCDPQDVIKAALHPMQGGRGVNIPDELFVGASGRAARLMEQNRIDQTKSMLMRYMKQMGANVRDAGTDLVGGDTDMSALNRMAPEPKAPAARPAARTPKKESKEKSKEKSAEFDPGYVQGLIDKCAELGVDPEALVKAALSPMTYIGSLRRQEGLGLAGRNAAAAKQSRVGSLMGAIQ
jgi:hypothetical protein